MKYVLLENEQIQFRTNDKKEMQRHMNHLIDQDHERFLGMVLKVNDKVTLKTVFLLNVTN